MAEGERVGRSEDEVGESIVGWRGKGDGGIEGNKSINRIIIKVEKELVKDFDSDFTKSNIDFRLRKY